MKISKATAASTPMVIQSQRGTVVLSSGVFSSVSPVSEWLNTRRWP